MNKTWKLFWGLGFILVAVALVLDALGVLAPIASAVGDVSILAIIAGLFLLCYAVVQLCIGKVGEVFVPLALIFMLFETNIAHIFGIGDDSGNIINNWLLLLCAVMLWIGFGILFSGIGRKGKRLFINRGANRSGSLGSSVRYIDCDGFKYEEIENDLGTCTVFFENTDKYEGGAVLDIDNDLGSVIINVPENWHVIVKIDNSLGSIQVPKTNATGPSLILTGDNDLGSVVIKTV